MHIDPNFLEISYENAGVRDSQKRLKALIAELAIEPLTAYHEELQHKFHMVQEIVCKRVAAVIIHWCQHKHEPVKPDSDDMMSTLTNSSRNDVTLGEFYLDQVKNGMYNLAPILGLEIPDPYDIETEELEYALIELEDRFEHAGIDVTKPNEGLRQYRDSDSEDGDYSISDMLDEYATIADVGSDKTVIASYKVVGDQRAIVLSNQSSIQKAPERGISVNVLNLSAERAWQLTYRLMGYQSEYIQKQMIPRWRQQPEAFERDRRFLYQSFIETIRNEAGAQVIAGNYVFADRPMSIDQLWQYYFADLSRNVGPLLVAAKLEANANDTWWKKLWKTAFTELRRISPIWLLALAIALVFDGLTTYVSLDQTPMEGALVWIFTILITALFQIADLLIISYRKREFEADGLVAKYRAQFDRYSATLDGLDTTSESYVQIITQKSKAQADFNAAQDSRKMARRGRFWSARIADINIIVTAYGFSFMFLNAQEPMYAIYQQVEVIRSGAWGFLNLWVFLMVGLAITVSFVINTAQRTEILGWSMRRLKNEP